MSSGDWQTHTDSCGEQILQMIFRDEDATASLGGSTWSTELRHIVPMKTRVVADKVTG